MPFAPSPAELPFQLPRDVELGLTGANRLQGYREGLGSQLGRGPDGGHLRGLLHRPEPFNELHRRFESYSLGPILIQL